MAGFLLALGLVPGEDLVSGELQRGAQVGIDAGERRCPLRSVDAERADLGAVELGRVAPERTVAARADRIDDLACGVGDPLVLVGRSGQQRAQIRVGASYVDASEQ